ncbi:MAG: rod shape-determining protein RodA [Gammaproteobacteria bacterium]|nr:rod shape-determining protein RodA [Gammaproteobacteria bacterium]
MYTTGQNTLLRRLHLDMPLLLGLLALSAVGLIMLYSSGGQDLDLVLRQSIRLAVAFTVMFFIAQISPTTLLRWSPWLFGIGLALLLAVLLLGVEGKGAQRWLDLGFFRFQPSELMKVAVPMMIAWYLAESTLPPASKRIIVATLIFFVPTLLIAKQPDLGTALLIGSSGAFVLLFAGLRWRLVGATVLLLIPTALLLWKFGMHAYQKQRVLTFLNPENDPLGAGYHIIQSKIAIGSGGLYGKGWLNGTQSQLEFLPERSTDFIFAVFGEEFGLLGILLLLSLYLFVILRGLYIAVNAQTTFTRLLAGSLTMTFLVYVFVNIGMVTGLLPVVGLPLPLISYGGSSMVTLMAAFGMLMSIQTHRRLLES